MKINGNKGKIRSKNLCYPLYSEEDADLAAMPQRKNADGYADRCGKGRTSMHRMVMARMLGRPLLRSEHVDHDDGNRLNNRRDNLKLTNNQGNCQNRHCGPYRGTHWKKDSQKYIAKVKHNTDQHFLGYFDTREEAAIAAKKKRLELGFFGEKPMESLLSIPEFRPFLSHLIK